MSRLSYSNKRKKLAQGRKPGESVTDYADRILKMARKAVEEAKNPLQSEQVLKDIEAVAARKAILPRGIGSSVGAIALADRNAKVEAHNAKRRQRRQERDGYGRARREKRVIRDATGRFVRWETVEDDG